jgi:phage-related protein
VVVEASFRCRVSSRQLLLSLASPCRAEHDVAGHISHFYIAMWVIAPAGAFPERPVVWLGSSLRDLRRFGPLGRRVIGRLIRRLQEGTEPSDWKPLTTVGRGVIELRAHADGEQRAVVVARFPEAVYVLHAFQKRSRKTSQHDLEVARRRYRDLMAERARR